MDEKDKRIKELDIEVMLQAEIIQHLLRHEIDPQAGNLLYDKLQEFIIARQDTAAQKQIELLRTQKQILLRKIMELYNRLAEWEKPWRDYL